MLIFWMVWQGTNYFRCDGSYPNTDMNTTAEGYWHVAPTASNLPAGAYYGHRWDYDHINNGPVVCFRCTPPLQAPTIFGLGRSAIIPLRRGTRFGQPATTGQALELDADLLDGQHGSHYLAWANVTGKPTIPTNNIPANKWFRLSNNVWFCRTV